MHLIVVGARIASVRHGRSILLVHPRLVRPMGGRIITVLSFGFGRTGWSFHRCPECSFHRCPGCSLDRCPCSRLVLSVVSLHAVGTQERNNCMVFLQDGSDGSDGNDGSWSRMHNHFIRMVHDVNQSIQVRQSLCTFFFCFNVAHDGRKQTSKCVMLIVHRDVLLGVWCRARRMQSSRAGDRSGMLGLPQEDRWTSLVELVVCVPDVLHFDEFENSRWNAFKRIKCPPTLQPSEHICRGAKGIY